MYEDYEPNEVNEKDYEADWTYADFLHDAMMEEEAIKEYEEQQKKLEMEEREEDV